MSKRANLPPRKRKTCPTILSLSLCVCPWSGTFEIADGLPDFCDDRAIPSSMKVHRLVVHWRVQYSRTASWAWTGHHPYRWHVVACAPMSMSTATGFLLHQRAFAHRLRSPQRVPIDDQAGIGLSQKRAPMRGGSPRAMIASGLRPKRARRPAKPIGRRSENSSGRSGSARRQLFAGLGDAQHFGKPEGQSR
jgi:hypothetical protein